MNGSETAADTNEAIMQATYRALCKHGYPATSISRIADEFSKSKSLLYYHYEDKEELLEDFLRYLLEQFESELEEIDDEEPYDHLLAVVEFLLPSEMDGEQLRFRRALLEIRSQAPYHETYHEQLERTDDIVISELVSAIERGIEAGVFRRVNSRRTAEFIYSTAHGAVGRGVTLDDPEVIRENREVIVDYIDSQLRRYAR
jgi:AcrR family transcriptional regulator